MAIIQERPIDVSRPALIRLLQYAHSISNKTTEHEHYTRTYWDGYIRALETVLDMEDE
jgi:hypothetical protein